MASSVVKMPYKITEKTISLSSLSWTASGLYFATYPSFTAVGKVVAIVLTSWSSINQTPTLSINSSGKLVVGMPTNSAPTSGSIGVRITELL